MIFKNWSYCIGSKGDVFAFKVLLLQVSRDLMD